MQVKSCKECAVILPAVLKENKTLKKELTAVENERQLLQEKNGILGQELGECEKKQAHFKKLKIGLGIGVGIAGTAAVVGSFFLGRATK